MHPAHRPGEGKGIEGDRNEVHLEVAGKGPVMGGKLLRDLLGLIVSVAALAMPVDFLKQDEVNVLKFVCEVQNTGGVSFVLLSIGLHAFSSVEEKVHVAAQAAITNVPYHQGQGGVDRGRGFRRVRSMRFGFLALGRLVVGQRAVREQPHKAQREQRDQIENQANEAFHAAPGEGAKIKNLANLSAFMSSAEFELKNRRGLALKGLDWDADGEVRAVIALIHGVGEHAGRYDHVAAWFNAKGVAFCAVDQVGHGRSGGKRGHAASYEELLETVDKLLAHARERFAGKPLFLYGHSGGGNLAINYALRHRSELTGVIASAPYLRLAFEPPAFQVKLAGVMNRLWSGFSQASGLEQAAISRDPQVVKAYAKDKLVHDRISAGFFLAMHTAGQWALQHATELDLPLLIMHGTADRLTDWEASKAFADKAGELAHFRAWEGCYHEIHNEPEKESVFRAMWEWMEARLG